MSVFAWLKICVCVCVCGMFFRYGMFITMMCIVKVEIHT